MSVWRRVVLVIAAGLGVVSSALAQPLAQVTPIAASASAAESNTPAAAAIDGKASTWWAGNGLGASLTLDLGSSQQVKQVRIAFHLGGVRAYNFEIQSSTDGQGYTSAGYFQSSGTSAAFEIFKVTAPGRFLRIVGSGNSVDRFNSYKEVQVFAEAPLTQLTPVAVSASQSEESAPAEAVADGNLNTYWLGSGVRTHLTLDWGATQEVKQVRIAFYNGNARVYGFQVRTSPDGVTYTSAGSFQSSGTTSSFESFNLNATGRYLRIVGWGNNINRDNAYYEVQAYGASGRAPR